MVRAMAAHAVTSLPAAEASALLIPLLQDKEEFVRREVAHSLGETHSRAVVHPLAELLATEKEVSVRAAAVLALGQIGDESAVPALAQVLSGVSSNKKSKKREDDFVMRSAAEALGKIRSRAGVEPLIAALTNEKNQIDTRRAAAEALGLIGDPSATPALQAALASDDPYLSEAARESLRRLRSAKK
jgi:HEAT repeat protein